ncbi:unnamed protein product, partial [Adineta steineri]
SVKYGKNNPLILSTTFPFDSQLQYSFSDLLKKSLITFIENDRLPKIYFKNEKFVFDLSTSSNSTITKLQNFTNIEPINQHMKHSSFSHPHPNINTNQNLSRSLHLNKINNLNLSVPDMSIFIDFVENIITSDPSHQGYICSCARGTYNTNLLFFNIAGKYKYCPKKNRHHQRNNVAIMINTKDYTYSIRCNSQDQTTATYIGDNDLINEYSSESLDSSSSLSPIDPPLVIHISPTKEQQRQIASSSSSNDNTLYEVNIKQQVPRSTNPILGSDRKLLDFT